MEQQGSIFNPNPPDARVSSSEAAEKSISPRGGNAGNDTSSLSFRVTFSRAFCACIGAAVIYDASDLFGTWFSLSLSLYRGAREREGEERRGIGASERDKTSTGESIMTISVDDLSLTCARSDRVQPSAVTYCLGI